MLANQLALKRFSHQCLPNNLSIEEVLWGKLLGAGLPSPVAMHERRARLLETPH